MLGALPAVAVGAPSPSATQPAVAPHVTHLRLSQLVGDGMVMQREARIPVWGWAAPADRVVVTFDDRDYAATPDAAGRWSVTLPPMPAGGPHAMTVAAGGGRVAVRDILVGDVWVCSGQSNMEFVVRDARDGAADVAAAHDPRIRHFKVPTSWAWAWAPSDSLAGGAWEPADPQHVGQFTAVGYFFARDLRKSVDVPIGLLHTSWGGSRIEPWTSREALGPGDAALARLQADERAYEARTRDSLRARIGGELPTRDAGMVDAVDGQHVNKIPQAVILDLGEADNIHPRDKQDVGARLALAARRVAYGQAVEASGPAYRRSRVDGGRIVVEFDHAGGLQARARGGVPAGTVGGFAVAGDDRRFAWADARIEGERVVVSSAAVPHPVAVRYAWADNPDRANLYNAAGLPAVPFGTDAW